LIFSKCSLALIRSAAIEFVRMSEGGADAPGDATSLRNDRRLSAPGLGLLLLVGVSGASRPVDFDDIFPSDDGLLIECEFEIVEAGERMPDGDNGTLLRCGGSVALVEVGTPAGLDGEWRGVSGCGPIVRFCGVPPTDVAVCGDDSLNPAPAANCEAMVGMDCGEIRKLCGPLGWCVMPKLLIAKFDELKLSGGVR
jgi:hypothetical protein